VFAPVIENVSPFGLAGFGHTIQPITTQIPLKPSGSQMIEASILVTISGMVWSCLLTIIRPSTWITGIFFKS